jgi:hypothetical protein
MPVGNAVVGWKWLGAASCVSYRGRSSEPVCSLKPDKLRNKDQARLESEIGLSQYKMRSSIRMSNVRLVCVILADRLDATDHNAGQHATCRGANAP